MQSEWIRPGPSVLWRPALLEIIRYRRLLLVHCCTYYRLDESLITDHQWQAWADYLALIQTYHGWEAGFYDEAFKDWDGSTGYHLPVDAHILSRAKRLLAYANTSRS